MSRTIEGDKNWGVYIDALVKRADRSDLFRQVGRTIGGIPVGDEQIQLSVAAARAGLDLISSDGLLDLCCGNGLITLPLSLYCAYTIGVDFNQDLIEIARERQDAQNPEYIHCSVVDLTAAHLNGRRPTKVCMLAAMQHFTVSGVKTLLSTLRPLVDSAATLYIDDVPDVDCLWQFYDTPARRADYEQRKAAGTEAIGTWWSRQHLVELFEAHGYRAEAFDQDPRRSGAHYRFDLRARPIGS